MTFPDVVDPTLAYVAPAAPGEPGGPAARVNLALNLASPAFWINELVREMTGRDPFGHVQARLAGDWLQVHQYGQVLDQLSAGLAGVAVNLGAGNRRLDATWNGHAADAGHEWFAGLAGRLTADAGVLHDLAAEYERASTGVWAIGQALGNALQAVVDAAIVAGAAMLAGAATAETLVGAAICGAVVADRTAAIVMRVDEVFVLVSEAAAAMMLLSGVVTARVADGAVLSRIPSPPGGYRHPALR